MNERPLKSKAGYWGLHDGADGIRLPDPCLTEARARRRTKYALGEGTDLPEGWQTTRPQGGAVTEWYKGKTHLPVWRQISTEICCLRHGAVPLDIRVGILLPCERTQERQRHT
jgi:hypothetical protein